MGERVTVVHLTFQPIKKKKKEKEKRKKKEKMRWGDRGVGGREGWEGHTVGRIRIMVGNGSSGEMQNNIHCIVLSIIKEGEMERGGESTFTSFDLVSQLEPHVWLAILQPLRSITAQCDNVKSGSGLLRMCARH